MKLENYPKYTIIMRNYTYEQSEIILSAMEGLEHDFAVEITLNTPNALSYINKLIQKFEHISIGAGTVRTLSDVRDAIDAGAQFLLGPHSFTKEMIELAKDENVLTIPSAMTPSEINNMFNLGADIVKVFPARALEPAFFQDVQAPLGKLPLMAVGGVSLNNSHDFFDNGVSYLGIGSGMFDKEDLEKLNKNEIRKSLQKFLN